MKLIDHLRQITAEQRQSLAQSCATSLGHLRNVAYGYRPCGAALAVRIEQGTSGHVTRRDLCPDDWQDIWPELADSQEKQAPALTQQAPAAINSEALQQAKGVA